jgi:hypothetical protein
LNPTLPDPLPPRIAALPVDPDRHFPIPWFVAYVNGKPEFRAMDGRKLAAAVKEKRCWVCGDRLGKKLAFLVGPMCAVNRISGEPPSHPGCATFSAKYCPFLSRPAMERRRDEKFDALGTESAGFLIERNPGVNLVWTTLSYKVVSDGNKGVLFQMGEPVDLAWFREGRTATRDEVLESVRTGLPILERAADEDPDPARARAHLARLARKAEPFYPRK